MVTIKHYIYKIIHMHSPFKAFCYMIRYLHIHLYIYYHLFKPSTQTKSLLLVILADIFLSKALNGVVCYRILVL